MNKLMTIAVAALVSAACFADEPADGARRPMRSNHPPMGERARMGGGLMGGNMVNDPLVRAVSNPQIAEKIGLSAEQKAKLQALKGEPGANRAAQEKIRKGMDRQMELLAADTIDEAAVMAAIDEVFEARKEFAKMQTKRLVAVRQILTPEQVAKAREAMAEFRGAKKGNQVERQERGPKMKKRAPTPEESASDQAEG